MWLTRQEAAKRLEITPRTLYNWERSGKIQGYKEVLPSGRYRVRYKTADIDDLMGTYPIVRKKARRWPWKKG